MTAIFETLCRASVFGLAALFVALCAQWLLGRRVPAAWRAWVWRVALLQSVFALLPLSPIRWQVLAPPAPIISAPPMGNASEFPSPEKSALLPDSVLESQSAPIPNAPLTQVAPPLPSAPRLTPSPTSLPSPPSTPLDWRALLLAVYVAGLAFRLTQLAHGALQLRRILRACTPIGDAPLLARCQTLAARLKLKRAPHLLQSASGSPFITGIWRPFIVLPRALCDADAIQLDAVLAHELAHCQRRDLAWSALLWLAQTLLWFHPLAWAARRFHGLETECACDELALQIAPIAPQSYGALLLNSMKNFTFHSPLAAGTCDGLFAFKTRLLRLNNAPREPRVMAKFAFAAALALSCATLVPLKLVARAQNAPNNAPIVAPKHPLAGSAVVQGVVTSKKTGEPVAGVPMILFSPPVNKRLSDKATSPASLYQKTVTDARGYFRFNTAGGGNHTLGVDGSVEMVKGNMRFLAYRIYDFKLQNGMKRDFKLQLGQSESDTMTQRVTKSRILGSAVIQGVVTSKRTGQPLAGVPMILIPNPAQRKPTNTGSLAPRWKPMSVVVWPARPTNKVNFNPDIRARQETVTDARGYFRFNAAGGEFNLLSDGQISVEPGNVTIRSQQVNVFKVKEGQKLEFNFELDKTLSKPDKARISAKAPKIKGTGSAVVQGVVTSKQSKNPLQGIGVVLMSNGKAEQSVTDARGYFRFSATAGRYVLAADNTLAVAPDGFVLQDGQKRDFKIELDEATNRKTAATRTVARSAVVQGLVTSKQTQKPLAGVTMVLVSKGDLQQTNTDDRGYFRFNAKGGRHTLGANGEINRTAKGTTYSGEYAKVFTLKYNEARNFAFAIDNAPAETSATPKKSAQANADVLSSASGQVVDENKRPLAGATVTLYQDSSRPKSVKSDSNGRFSFQGLRPSSRIFISSSLSGYGATRSRIIENGKNRVYALSMPRASATLRGVVLGEDGQPARNFQVQVSGSVPTAKTDAQGRFFLPQVEPGESSIRVLTPNGGNGWGPIKVRGGDQDMEIRLTRSLSDARFPVIAAGPKTSINSSDKTRALIGQVAPAIQAFRWANGKAAPLASLRGKVVLLAFQDFLDGDKKALGDFARAFASTARVVGVQINRGGFKDSQPRIDTVSTRLDFPIAIDTSLGDNSGTGGLTLRAYGFGVYGYAVVGRDGRIIYAGDELNRAIQFASR